MSGSPRTLPFAVRRLAVRHAGGTGIIVYGWFPRVVYLNPDPRWGAVGVYVDGEERTVLDKFDRGPVWIELGTRRRRLVFSGTDPRGEPRRRFDRQLEPGEIRFIGFRPPQDYFRLFQVSERWHEQRMDR